MLYPIDFLEGILMRIGKHAHLACNRNLNRKLTHNKVGNILIYDKVIIIPSAVAFSF